uniref:Beta-defensin n=1 Tax=Sarcophilus harrisii TaxID=9305 RepID=A0A7N4NLW5_SARHA
ALLVLLSLLFHPHEEKKCFNNTGRCRASCKTKEKEHTTCDNKKKCCVPSDKVPKDASDSSELLGLGGGGGWVMDG